MHILRSLRRRRASFSIGSQDPKADKAADAEAEERAAVEWVRFRTIMKSLEQCILIRNRTGDFVPSPVGLVGTLAYAVIAKADPAAEATAAVHIRVSNSIRARSAPR